MSGPFCSVAWKRKCGRFCPEVPDVISSRIAKLGRKSTGPGAHQNHTANSRGLHCNTSIILGFPKRIFARYLPVADNLGPREVGSKSGEMEAGQKNK